MATVWTVVAVVSGWLVGHPVVIWWAVTAASSVLAELFRKKGWIWPTRIARLLAVAGFDVTKIKQAVTEEVIKKLPEVAAEAEKMAMEKK